MKRIYFKQFNKFLPLYLVMIALVILMSTSYALLRNSARGEKTYTMNVGNLSVSFIDQNTNEIEITNMYPMTDDEGMAQNGAKDILEFTVTNDGTLKANYNVYIEELDSTIPMSSVIKYSFCKKGPGDLEYSDYSEPILLSTNNYIEEKGTLNIGDSSSYKVKMWLIESADKTYMNKIFKARVVVEALQYEKTASEKVLEAAIKTGTCANKTTKPDTDDFGNPMTYISGTNDCIDFNYVWYSGKMWRIVAIYNDGSMKLVTDNNITSIAYNYPNTETWFYKTDTGAKSYMYQWLNEDFLDTLVDYNEVIDTTKYWNATMPANTTISTKPAVYNQNEELLSTMIPTSISPVGLLNNYEYYKSYQNASGYSNGYLKIGYYFWLLNPYDASNVWDVRYNGLGSRIGPINLYGARPSIIIKSGISFSGGTGSSDNPYIIITSNKETGKTNEFVNNRLSGEYIKFKSDGNNGNYNTAPLYRIVGTEGEGQNKITKIVAMDFATYDVTDAETGETTTANTKKFGASRQVLWGTCTTTDCWNGYFNETDSETGNWTGDWYSSLSFTSKLAKGTYYLGAVPNNDKNYKRAVCSATNFDTTKTIKDCIDAGTIATTWNSGYVGILRYGEMFATRQKTGDVRSITYMWLISPYSASNVWNVFVSGIGYSNGSTLTFGARPSYYLQSNVKIESGSGLETDPYIID